MGDTETKYISTRSSRNSSYTNRTQRATRRKQTGLRIARDVWCDGLTVNRRTVSLSDKQVERDRRRYEDRCARIPSRPGAAGSTNRPDTLTQTALAITSGFALQRRGRP